MSPHDELLSAAREQTGLDDFGDDSFREGLELLVRDLRDHARLNSTGQRSIPALLVQLLGQRLQIEGWYRRHPEIDDEPVTAPLIGIGLPRTGSTALSFLLAEDPNARSLRRWEANEPCPPPGTVQGEDPRIETGKAQIAEITRLSPRTLSMVPGSPTGPMECLPLLGLSFASHYFQAFAQVPNYSRWLLHDADLSAAYAYERRVLKLLQWRRPAKPWRLKTPSHLLWLDHLDTAFPDARFVWTHRDPAAVIVSVADLCTEVAGRFSDDVDPKAMGALNVEHWSTGMARALAFREKSEARGADRFHDIDFRAMQQDPVAEVRRLYAWLGEPVTEAFADGMAAWWEESAAHRERAGHPEPAAFGIEPDRIAPLFADYTARIPQWTRH
ncbi:sulfotransferase family protein [Streptomyces sp. NPDC048288]|uniref:sulfotransferase family protein n=1 Tax=Streptomyces sp. NPDC048288 TaxID=3365529 RepID=UPI00371C1A01